MPRPDHLLLLAALATTAGCSAFKLPAGEDPDPSRHTYEVVGEARRLAGGAVVAGAVVTVSGAREVAGSQTTDETGRFWLMVSGIGGSKPDPAGVGKGPAGLIVVSARAGALCSPETKVILPAKGPVLLSLETCPPKP